MTQLYILSCLFVTLNSLLFDVATRSSRCDIRSWWGLIHQIHEYSPRSRIVLYVSIHQYRYLLRGSPDCITGILSLNNDRCVAHSPHIQSTSTLESRTSVHPEPAPVSILAYISVDFQSWRSRCQLIVGITWRLLFMYFVFSGLHRSLSILGMAWKMARYLMKHGSVCQILNLPLLIRRVEPHLVERNTSHWECWGRV